MSASTVFPAVHQALGDILAGFRVRYSEFRGPDRGTDLDLALLFFPGPGSPGSILLQQYDVRLVVSLVDTPGNVIRGYDIMAEALKVLRLSPSVPGATRFEPMGNMSNATPTDKDRRISWYLDVRCYTENL